MNINEFVREYYRHNPNGHYFDNSTLKFFGECRSKMRVFKRTVEVVDVWGESTRVIALASGRATTPAARGVLTRTLRRPRSRT